MFRFVLQKIWSKKWLILSLLLGNLLMVAIVASGPIYSQASLQRALTRDLSDHLLQINKDPGTVVVSGQYNHRDPEREAAFDRITQLEQSFDAMVTDLQIPALLRFSQYYKDDVQAVHGLQLDDGQAKLNIKLTGLSDVDEHITITNGRMYENILDGNVIEVIVNEKTFVNCQLMLGEELELLKLTSSDGKPYKIRIVGIYENSLDRDPYWLTEPTGWDRVCVMDYELFRSTIADSARMDQSFKADWCAVLDYTKIESKETEYYLGVLDFYGDKFDDLKATRCNAYFQSVLTDFLPEFQKLNTTICVLLAPIVVLLAAFIFMVSAQMLDMEQNEISIFKSRGAGKSQIILLYLLQSLIIALVSIAGGVPLGYFMCSLLGASNSFLGFVQRAALPLETGANVWIFASCAALFSVCTMVVPVLKHANVSIVDHKRQKNRQRKRPVWQLLFLDVILLGVSVYGLYQYNAQKTLLAQRVIEGASLDPLLYGCTSLFMIGAALLILRIFPWVVKLIFAVGKKWWSPAMYASFLRIIRTRGNQGFLMVFLILTVAMGIFNAQTARTINANAEEKIQYITGADIVLQEQWDDNSELEEDMGTAFELVYTEPDFQKYVAMDGVANATKVLVDHSISASVEGGTIRNTTLMGIHTKEFGQIAWLRDDLLTHHFYDYLNVISQNASAILVSSNFRDVYELELGDVITYSGSGKDTIRGIIYGFVDYWPGYAPVALTKTSSGIYEQTEQFLIVAHLEQLQANWGVTPYQVWIDAEGSTQFLYDYAQENGIKFAMFQDTANQIVQLKNDPIFQGTNGILTIGFICILLLCTMGFLIYWILSIQSRTLQFGIFRAMGMHMREVFTMLINEQVFITGISLAAGVLVGLLTSKLFIPLIQIAYSSADQILPLVIVSESRDFIRLFTVIGSVILVCMAVLGILISRIKIFQALKLGED